jgi:hypothetical protein
MDAHEMIYLGQVRDRQEVYGLVHICGNSNHFNFGLSYKGLAGYLEGAFAAHFSDVALANGIPSDIRGSCFPGIELSRIDVDTLYRLLKDSGIGWKLGFPIRSF